MILPDPSPRMILPDPSPQMILPDPSPWTEIYRDRHSSWFKHQKSHRKILIRYFLSPEFLNLQL